MKPIIMYQADDGSEWATEHAALERDALYRAVTDAMAPLGPQPSLRGDDDYHQHDPRVVLGVMRAVMFIGAPNDAQRWLDSADGDMARIHPMSVVGRVLCDSSDSPVSTAWARICRIDHLGREWRQAFFANRARDEATR